MQLNTLNSIRKKIVFNEPSLPKIGHRILNLHHHLFVFGGLLRQNGQNSIIHCLDTQTNQIQTLQTSKLPQLEGFALFQYDEFIYLWGGATSNPQNSNSSILNNNLLQFDGSKIVNIKQLGQIPSPRCFFAYTTFSKRYLIISGGFDNQKFYNTWHIMDLKNFTWRQVKISMEMPFSYSSKMMWLNGRGYILLQQAYFHIIDQFHQNLFYEFKFQNFGKLKLNLISIKFPQSILNMKVQFSTFCFLESNTIIIFGGQKKFMKKHFSYHKNAVIYNYETLQWKQFVLDFQGSQFQSLYCDGRLFIVGGVKSDTSLFSVQVFQIKSIFNSSSFQLVNSFQNAVCYNCESIYSYKQQDCNYILKSQFQSNTMKYKIQNKFLWKFSQIFRTPFQAIGSLLDWFISMSYVQISISLNDSYISQSNPELAKKIFDINQDKKTKYFNFFKLQGQTQGKSLLSFQEIQNCFLKETYAHLCNQNQIKTIAIQDPSEQKELKPKMNCFFQLKLASLRLGYSYLYVTFTKQNFITVIYISCIQTQSPEMAHKKNTAISYNIFQQKDSDKYEYSSLVNRHIIFQNLNIYFQNQQSYEQTLLYFNQKRNPFINKEKNLVKSTLYIFDCNQLGKKQVYSFENFTKKDQEKNISREKTQKLNHDMLFTAQSQNYKHYDIIMRSISSENSQNSLIKYIEILYLNLKNIRIKVQNTLIFKEQKDQMEISKNPLRDFFKEGQGLQKIKSIKLCHAKQKSSKLKNQLQDTHFTTMQDESQVTISNLQVFKSWSLYQSLSINFQYKGVFFYIKNRLIFVYKNQKFPYIQGIIQLNQMNVKSEVSLNKSEFLSYETENEIQKWLMSLQRVLRQKK